MNYFLIKLAFDTAVHFGPSDTAQSLFASENTLCADTVFSALCHTALQLGGETALKQLCDLARAGDFLLSDAMPWKGADYFLPRPFVLTENNRKELPAPLQKAMKKLAWLPVRSFQRFSESVRGGTPFDPAQCSAFFGFSSEVVRAAVPRSEADAVPYQVGIYQFAEDSGLYLIIALKTAEQETFLISLFHALGLSGIGGKVSSGYGKFHLADKVFLNESSDEQAEWFYHALTEKKKCSLLISTSLPRDRELEVALDSAAYQVIRRSGFVSSESYSEHPMKKKTQYFFRVGSTFSGRFEGDLYAVGSFGRHQVYRYGKSLFLGVDL